MIDLDAMLGPEDPEEALEELLDELDDEDEEPEEYICRACCAGDDAWCSGNGCECPCRARSNRERARRDWMADDPRI
jgi:hypothetical protein